VVATWVKAPNRTPRSGLTPESVRAIRPRRAVGEPYQFGGEAEPAPNGDADPPEKRTDVSVGAVRAPRTASSGPVVPGARTLTTGVLERRSRPLRVGFCSGSRMRFRGQSHAVARTAGRHLSIVTVAWLSTRSNSSRISVNCGRLTVRSHPRTKDGVLINELRRPCRLHSVPFRRPVFDSTGTFIVASWPLQDGYPGRSPVLAGQHTESTSLASVVARLAVGRFSGRSHFPDVGLELARGQ